MKGILLMVIVWARLLGTASAGSLLIWLPLMSKSIKITVMPVAEAMANRGHEVVIVLSHPTPEESTYRLTINSMILYKISSKKRIISIAQ